MTGDDRSAWVRPAAGCLAAAVFALTILLGACGPKGDGKSVSSTPDAMRLLNAAVARLAADDLALNMRSSETEVTVKGGECRSEEVAADVDIQAPSQVRGWIEGDMGGGTRVKMDVVAVDTGTIYVRLPDGSGWMAVETDQNDSPANTFADYKKEMEAVDTARVTGIGDVDGVSCWVVAVTVDVVEDERLQADQGLAKDVAKALGISRQQAEAAFPDATDKALIWIGRDDGILCRIEDDVIVNVGAGGTYEAHGDTYFTQYGKTIDPPIAVPSPLVTHMSGD